MAKTILIKRSRSQFPPEQLQFGELAFADESDRLFIGKADGSILSGYLSERSPAEWEAAIDEAIAHYAAPVDHRHDTPASPQNYLDQPYGENRACHLHAEGVFHTLNTDGSLYHATWSGKRIEVGIAGSRLSLLAVPSDAQWKENIDYSVDVSGLSDMLKAVRFCRFTWRADSPFSPGEYSPLGVIAQDLQHINPYWVETLSDGSLHVDVTAVLLSLAAVLQELLRRVDTLEASP
jgi:hypothetical protein